MEINLGMPHPEFAALHEIFHLIQFELLLPERGASDAGIRQYATLHRFIQSTVSYRQNVLVLYEARKLHEFLMATGGSFEGELKEAAYQVGLYEYYSRLHEAAARYYSQVIHEYSRNQDTKTADIIKKLDHHTVRLFLPNDESKAFKKHLISLFSDLGWRKRWPWM